MIDQLTTLAAVAAWAQTATRSQLIQAQTIITTERDSRRRTPVTDHKGRKWATEDSMNCAYEGCRGCSRCRT